MVRDHWVTALLCVWTGLAGGCLPRWQPSLDRVQPAVPHTAIDLTRYLGPAGGPPRVYLRRDPVNPQEPPTPYERRPLNGALTEGLLADRQVDRVAAYLEPTPRARQRRGTLWPEDPDHKSAAFFLEFEPPLVRLPASIDANGGLSQRCRLRYYNRDAVEGRGGTVARDIVFEGFETVQVGGGEYPACVRLRINTRYRIHWGPWLDSTEYLWLAPDVGEVLRVELFSGLALFAYFTGLHVYELTDGTPPETQPTRLVHAAPPPVEAWARCAVFLDRVLPHPRLGGLAVELAPAQDGSALTTAQARPPRHTRR